MNRLASIAALIALCAATALAQNPVAEKSTNAQPPKNEKNQGQPVTGKTPGMHGSEPPASTSGSADTNTPGYQTETGVEQQPGKNTDVPSTGPARGGKQRNKAKGAVVPPDMQMAGQTPEQADKSAQAAGRAEIEPGKTLGVDQQQATNPRTGGTAQLKQDGTSASAMPQSDAGAKQGTKAKRTRHRAGRQKRGQATKSHQPDTSKSQGSGSNSPQ